MLKSFLILFEICVLTSFSSCSSGTVAMPAAQSSTSVSDQQPSRQAVSQPPPTQQASQSLTDAHHTETNGVPHSRSEVSFGSAKDSRDLFNTDLNFWTLISDEAGIKTYRERQPSGDIVSFRGVTILHAPIEKIAVVLNSPELRKDWVDELEESHTIEMKSIWNRVEYVRSKVPWPFQDRDFVFSVQVQVERKPYSIYIKMKSVEDARESPHSGVVRGEMLHAYYFLRDISTLEAVATQMVVEIAVDPKGSIPSWVVNMTQKKWPTNTLHSLDIISSRKDLPVSPEIADYFKNR